MAVLSTQMILTVMAAVLFGLGFITTIIGILILASRATDRDIRSLAAQTTKLAQKGLAENVAGLVGNASALLEAVNDLIRTTAGIGVFLTVIGFVLMIAAGLLLLQSI